MKKLIKPLKSKAMLRIAMFATLFVLLDTFIEMNKKTEEQTTYSITLEDLLHGQTETNGENGGGVVMERLAELAVMERAEVQPPELMGIQLEVQIPEGEALMAHHKRESIKEMLQKR